MTPSPGRDLRAAGRGQDVLPRYVFLRPLTLLRGSPFSGRLPHRLRDLPGHREEERVPVPRVAEQALPGVHEVREAHVLPTAFPDSQRGVGGSLRRGSEERAVLHREERAGGAEVVSEAIREAVCGVGSVGGQSGEEAVRLVGDSSGDGEASSRVRLARGAAGGGGAEHPDHVGAAVREQCPAPGEPDRVRAER